MSHHRFATSRSDNWTNPRSYTDASLRYMKHGPLQSMDYNDSGIFASLARLLARLWGVK